MTEEALNQPVPYTVQLDDELLELTKQKLKLTRLPKELKDLTDDDWSHGAKVKEVQRLAKYWEKDYDWRAQEVRPHNGMGRLRYHV